MIHSHPPLVRTLSRLRVTFWRRRLIQWLVRATWLALLVPTVVMAGYLWWGWQVPWDLWLSLMLLVGLASLLWSLRPLSLQKMTRRLDDMLGVRAQLVTALEVSQATAQANNPVAEQLVQNAVNLTVSVRRQVNLFNRGFWLEMQALIAVAAILGAMLTFDLLRPAIPNATPVDLPLAGQEPQADEVMPPDPRLQPPPPQNTQTISEQELRAALQALADALRDQAVTRAISEAIDRGDLEGAAAETRRLVDRLDELSEQAQQELGDNLQEAADNIGGTVPSLTNPLQRGNQALEAGNLEGAGEALEQLAETLDAIAESTLESGQPEASEESQEAGQAEGGESEEEGQEAAEEGEGSGDGAGSGGSGEQGLGEEEERLPIDGQPLELEGESDVEERVLQPSELDAPAGDEQTTDSPFARQPLNAPSDDLGPDPLTYPWEKREIIRQYFTP